MLNLMRTLPQSQSPVDQTDFILSYFKMDRGGIEPPTLGPMSGSPACEAGVRTAELPALDCVLVVFRV